ncbi:hypothetical protein [Paracidovorax citrulli]
MSINDYWQIRWSDGYLSGWPPAEVPLRRCMRCEHVFWLEDGGRRAPVPGEERQYPHGIIGRLLGRRRATAAKDDLVHDIEPPHVWTGLDIDGYLLALESLNERTRHRERALRTYLWWHLNHARRHGSDRSDTISATLRGTVEQANRLALLCLLDDDVDGVVALQFQRVELLRQMSNFRGAAENLKQLMGSANAKDVAILGAHIAQHDVAPCILSAPALPEKEAV